MLMELCPFLASGFLMELASEGITGDADRAAALTAKLPAACVPMEEMRGEGLISSNTGHWETWGPGFKYFTISGVCLGGDLGWGAKRRLRSCP